MIIPKNSTFLGHNLKLHRMIDMHLKFDKMHINGMFYALIFIINHLITSINCMLSHRSCRDQNHRESSLRHNDG